MKIKWPWKKAEKTFDWSSVPLISKEEVESWFGCTDAMQKQLPFQIALQVHDEFLKRLTEADKMDPLQMAEARGALMATSRFCKIYKAILEHKPVETFGDDA